MINTLGDTEHYVICYLEINLVKCENRHYGYNPAPSWHIPVGLNFLFLNFESKN